MFVSQHQYVTHRRAESVTDEQQYWRLTQTEASSPDWVITSVAANVSGPNNRPGKLDPEIIKLSADDRETIFGQY